MRFILASLVAVVGGCGGGSSPVEKCDDLVDVVCDRGVECIPASGSHSQCVMEVQAALPCGSAKAVSASYSRCVSQMKSLSCSVLFPGGQLDLPADCDGVILTSRTQPEEVEAPTSPTSLDALRLTTEE